MRNFSQTMRRGITVAASALVLVAAIGAVPAHAASETPDQFAARFCAAALSGTEPVADLFHIPTLARLILAQDASEFEQILDQDYSAIEQSFRENLAKDTGVSKCVIQSVRETSCDEVAALAMQDPDISEEVADLVFADFSRCGLVSVYSLDRNGVEETADLGIVVVDDAWRIVTVGNTATNGEEDGQVDIEDPEFNHMAEAFCNLLATAPDQAADMINEPFLIRFNERFQNADPPVSIQYLKDTLTAWNPLQSCVASNYFRSDCASMAKEMDIVLADEYQISLSWNEITDELEKQGTNECGTMGLEISRIEGDDAILVIYMAKAAGKWTILWHDYISDLSVDSEFAAFADGLCDMAPTPGLATGTVDFSVRVMFPPKTIEQLGANADPLMAQYRAQFTADLQQNMYDPAKFDYCEAVEMPQDCSAVYEFIAMEYEADPAHVAAVARDAGVEECGRIMLFATEKDSGKDSNRLFLFGRIAGAWQMLYIMNFSEEDSP